jgi:hypothetical protein
MDHQDAVRTGAVERYLLGQLSGPESEEFETHFFDCMQCAQDLRAGALFEENARTVFSEQAAAERAAASRAGSPPAPRSLWAVTWGRPWAAVPALAALALVGVSAYQSLVVIPGLRGQLRQALSPQPMASYVLPPTSRGDAQALEIPADGLFYAVYMDPTWEGSFAAYMCSVQDESGSTRFSVQLPAPPPGKPIQVLLTRSLLPSGRYTVVIRNIAETGKPEAELARYALVVKLD